MAKDSMAEEQKHELPTSVDVTYKLSPLNRVIHVDGAWGGVTSRVLVHVALYSEHPTIPEQGTVAVPTGQETIKKSTDRPPITREIEAELLMTPEVALALRNWIDGRLKTVEEIQKQTRKKRTR